MEMEELKNQKVSVQEALKILEEMIQQSTPISSPHIVAKPHMGHTQLFLSDLLYTELLNASGDDGSGSGGIYPFKVYVIHEEEPEGSGTYKNNVYVNYEVDYDNSMIYLGTESLSLGKIKVDELSLTLDSEDDNGNKTYAPVYVNIYVNYDRTADEYSYEIKQEDAEPTQSNTKYGVNLAIIHNIYYSHDDNRTTWVITQYQDGHIHVTDRVV